MIRILKYGEVANEEVFARAVPEVNVTGVVAEIIQMCAATEIAHCLHTVKSSMERSWKA